MTTRRRRAGWEPVGSRGRVIAGDGSETGLADESADVAIGEAMLTMQSDRSKSAIAAEAFRVLRPGGRYSIHKLALNPDALPDEDKTELRKSLARLIEGNAGPPHRSRVARPAHRRRLRDHRGAVRADGASRSRAASSPTR
ncbi:class I SAM-dependent methyltransferase [Gordonia sp. C13]|uniref:class I SAM-dependent methyltransferase n=1 Tax=Gordonia sp. C13 TaxID=2935078 RepID=UPI0035A8B248